MTEQNAFLLALVIKPFVLVVVFVFLAVCIRRPIQRHMKEGKLKRFLLKKIN